MSNPNQPNSNAGPVEEKKPEYIWHKGSIRVSGKSQVFKTGLSAFHELKHGTANVEFVFLGANAGHQAFKACVCAKREIEAILKKEVVFIPMWTTDMTEPIDGRPGGVKDVSIWRILVLGPIKPKDQNRS